MKKVTIKKAERIDIDWINLKYQEIDFVKSNFDNEFIIIAQIENKFAGLGRLVKIDDKNVELGGIYTFQEFRGLGVADKIVNTLCTDNPFGKSIVWCLPFENLLDFYIKFGFKNHQNQNVPEEVQAKLDWCNSDNRYKKKVMLLFKEN